MTDRPTTTAASRTTCCAWCHDSLETERPWRPDEYHVHRDCLPALDEYREKVRSIMWKGVRDAL